MLEKASGDGACQAPLEKGGRRSFPLNGDEISIVAAEIQAFVAARKGVMLESHPDWKTALMLSRWSKLW